jgi:hypothetical protein
MFAAQVQVPPPDFAADDVTSWLPVGDDYLPPASGPGPITFDPAHPYIPNFTGKQPTYRVADLTNPILQPWAAEQMRKANEGDTLVVDTVGLNERTFVDNYRTPHTSQLHVVERYRLTDGGNMLEVAFQVEDPGAFTARWSAIQRFRRVHRAPMSELPCVESNTRYFNYETYPVPSADKPDF